MLCFLPHREVTCDRQILSASALTIVEAAAPAHPPPSCPSCNFSFLRLFYPSKYKVLPTTQDEFYSCLIIHKGLPGGAVVKNLPAMQEIQDVGSIPGSGRSPGVGSSNPLQYSCLENSIDRGAWQATVHGVAVRRLTRRSTRTIIYKLNSSLKFPGHVLLCFKITPISPEYNPENVPGSFLTGNTAPRVTLF